MASPFLYDDYYQLKADISPITLDLIFGTIGQSPNYTVYLDDTALANLTHCGVSKKNIPVGNNTNLNGRILTIVGNLVDIPGTDDTLTLVMAVKGGKTDLTKKYSVTTTTGDAAALSLTIRFTN
jgi:hypothetical protein